MGCRFTSNGVSVLGLCFQPLNKYSADIGNFAGDGAQRLERIQALAHEKLDNLTKARLSFSVGGKRIVMREAVFQTINAISKFKDVVSLVLAADRYAAALIRDDGHYTNDSLI